MKPELTAERLRELLHYNPETGVFTRLSSRGGTAKAGSQAGSNNGGGYLRIMVDRRLYLAHRLAWFYVHGSWPEFDVDHVNHRRSDNRLINLRDINRAGNTQNRSGANRNSGTGVRGVGKRRGSYIARVMVDGEYVHISRHTTLLDASLAAETARRRLQPGHIPKESA